MFLLLLCKFDHLRENQIQKVLTEGPIGVLQLLEQAAGTALYGHPSYCS